MSAISSVGSHIGWQKKMANDVDNKSHNEIRSGKKSLK